MDQTKKLIVDLSALPCSIIVVGVGGANFSQMEELDGDDGPLRDKTGRACHRDIVQFVEFNKCLLRGNLAQQVLKELPDQFCKHMERMGVKPEAQV